MSHVTALSYEDSLLDLEDLKRVQNEQLLSVLEEEQTRENEREHMLVQVGDAAEKRRLEKIFGVERAKANDRIMRMTAYARLSFLSYALAVRAVVKLRSDEYLCLSAVNTKWSLLSAWPRWASSKMDMHAESFLATLFPADGCILSSCFLPVVAFGVCYWSYSGSGYERAGRVPFISLACFGFSFRLQSFVNKVTGDDIFLSF